MARRLTALAQLVVLYAEKGITSTKALVQSTGYSKRAIIAAKGEARRTQGAAQCTPEVQPAAPSEVKPAAPRAQPAAPSAISSSPLKKKGLPHTPSKEKIHPPPPRLADRDSNLTTLETRGEGAREDFSSVPAQKKEPSPFSPVPCGLDPPKAPPVFAGSNLVVTADQHQQWGKLFPGASLASLYRIADADCLERGRKGAAAVVWAQKKIAYLLRDEERELTPEEAKRRRIEAALRAENPKFFFSGTMHGLG